MTANSSQRVLIAPHRSRFNRFIDNFAEAVAKSGRTVAGLDWKAREMRRSAFLIVHWPDLFFSLRKTPRALLHLARIALARAAGARLIWVVHNVVPHAGGRTPLPAALFMRSLDGTIFMSRASRSLALEHYPVLARTRQLLTVHGEYQPVRQRTPMRPVAPDRPVHILTFGLLRRYKNVEALIGAMAGLPQSEALLTVTGYSADAAYAAELAALATPGVTVDSREAPLSDEMLDDAIDAADLVILPYRDILHSGGALHTLSRNRPIVLPRRGAMPELREAVGREWVFLYDGALDPATIADALRWLRETDRAATVDMGAFSWDIVARDLAGFLGGFEQDDDR